MSGRIGLVYNAPSPGAYHDLGEAAAIEGVLDAVSSVGESLHALGYEVVTLGLKPPLHHAEDEILNLGVDLVFNLFEGFGGLPETEAAFAALLEKKGLCFTGSPGSAIKVCQDKSRMKQILRSLSLPTPDWQVLSPDNLADFSLNLPCIVKPLGEHASHGMSEKSVVADLTELGQQVAFIQQAYGRPSLVEEYLPGREFSVLVMGNLSPEAFPVEEITYSLPSDKPRILTYGAKWNPDEEYFTQTKPECPAKIDAQLTQELQQLAIGVFIATGCRGYARVDLRLDGKGKPSVIDINPNPDISPQSGARLQTQAAGLESSDFIEKILSLAIDRFSPAVCAGSLSDKALEKKAGVGD